MSFIRSSILISILSVSSLSSQRIQDFPSSIPVVDMQNFENMDTRHRFIEDISNALHNYGFFAVSNPGVELDILREAYNTSKIFFQSNLKKKREIHDPKSNGQRGYVLSERAQGEKAKDLKEFIHIGHANNLWPSWMDLQNPMENILNSLYIHQNKIEKALSLALQQEESFLESKTVNSSSLMRALYYPKNNRNDKTWAAAHTDIDLFTILPISSYKGLQVFVDGVWIDVVIPPDCFIVNGGDMLENLSNGYFRSSNHRVVSMAPDADRYSIVYFVHGHDQADFSPLPLFVEKTGGIQRYPQATEMELLAHRLVELGLAGDALIKLDAESGYMERVSELVQNGQASASVQKTYDTWKRLRIEVEFTMSKPRVPTPVVHKKRLGVELILYGIYRFILRCGHDIRKLFNFATKVYAS